MVEHEGGELKAGKHVQTAEQITSPEKLFADKVRILKLLLDKITLGEN